MLDREKLIKANALVDFLKEQRAKETGAYSKGRNDGLNVAISAIRNEEICPAVDAVSNDNVGSNWIPVGERKPDLIPCDAGTAYSEAVIVCTSGKKIMVAVWDGIDFLCDMDYWEAWGEQITHWVPIDWLLPLPELPKEDS